MKVLNITRQQYRASAVRYDVLIEYTLAGNVCQHTFPLNYREDPTQEKLDADVAQRVKACELLDQVRAQVKGDARAAASWIDQRSGEVRVLLANKACPQGCEVRALAELTLVLARLPQTPRAPQVPDVAAVIAKYSR